MLFYTDCACYTSDLKTDSFTSSNMYSSRHCQFLWIIQGHNLITYISAKREAIEKNCVVPAYIREKVTVEAKLMTQKTF